MVAQPSLLVLPQLNTYTDNLLSAPSCSVMGNAGLWCLLCAGCLVTGVVIPITAIRHDAKIEVEGIGTLVRSVAARARRRCATLNVCTFRPCAARAR